MLLSVWLRVHCNLSRGRTEAPGRGQPLVGLGVYLWALLATQRRLIYDLDIIDRFVVF